MATQNGYFPPNKRPRPSYDGYQSNQRAVYQSTFLPREAPPPVEKPSGIWTFSRNLIGSLCETSKSAVERVKAAGSFLLGFGGPWPADERNGSYADETYSPIARPGEKRKLNPDVEQFQSPVPRQACSTPLSSSVSIPEGNLSAVRTSIFQTPWTNATQKEAILLASVLKSQPKTARRVRFEGASRRQLNDAFITTMSTSKSSLSDADVELGEENPVLEESFTEELEPTAAAVLSAAPAEMARAEASHSPSRFSLVRAPLESFNNAILKGGSAEAVLREVNGVAEIFTEENSRIFKKSLNGHHDVNLAGSSAPGANFDEVKLISGHIESEFGVRDSHGGKVDGVDAFEPDDIPVNTDSDEDGSQEGDLKGGVENVSYDDEEEEDVEEDAEEEDGDEDEEVDDSAVVMSSGSEDEEDTDQLPYGLAADLAEKEKIVHPEENEENSLVAAANLPEASVGTFADYRKLCETQSPTVEDSNLAPSSTLPGGEGISIDFLHVSGSEDLENALTSDQLEELVHGEENSQNAKFDGDFQDDPEILLAEEQEGWEDEDEDAGEGGDEENGENQDLEDDDSDIICEGVFVKPPVAEEEDFDEEDGDLDEGEEIDGEGSGTGEEESGDSSSDDDPVSV